MEAEGTGLMLAESGGSCRKVVIVRFGWLYFGARGFVTMHLGIPGGVGSPQVCNASFHGSAAV